MADYAGFDMVPRLHRSVELHEKWEQFINEIVTEYSEDPDVRVNNRYIAFDIPGNPQLPIEGTEFTSFGVLLTPSRGGYVDVIKRYATHFFGTRIRG